MELQYIDDVLLHPAVLAKCCQAVENYWQHMYITVNCQLGKRSTDRSVSGVVGTRIDRELAFMSNRSTRATRTENLKNGDSPVAGTETSLSY